MSKKDEKVVFTRQEYEEARQAWIDIGKKKAQGEIYARIAEALGLYELFETKKEDY